MGKSKQKQKQKDKRRRGAVSGAGRAVRLQALIREEVNSLLRCEVGDARLQHVSITFVELTPDGSSARLWFSADGDEDRTVALERAAGFFRSQLAESLALKRTPELRFRRDPTTRALTPESQEVP